MVRGREGEGRGIMVKGRGGEGHYSEGRASW